MLCSNWGNWQYQAGVGNDPRAFRQFNQIKQANDYDANADYILTWIPELGQVDRRYAHTPWCKWDFRGHQVMTDHCCFFITVLSAAEKKRCGLGTQGGYPSCPLLEQPQWKKHYPHNKAPPQPRSGKQGKKGLGGRADQRQQKDTRK